MFSVSDASDAGSATIRLQLASGTWTVSTTDPSASLRVNGRLVTQRLLRDGDFIGCGRSLFRIDLVNERPADTAPRRTITLEDAANFQPRQKGFSTVVTAPGRWGNVYARWYGGAVLHLYGPADPHPDQLVARLGQRVRCHVILSAGSAHLPPGERSLALSEGLRVIPLDDSENADASFIGRLWEAGEFLGVLSPLEPRLLVDTLRPLAPLFGYSAAMRSFLTQAEASVIDALRAVDAGLLLNRHDGWELFCCPAMLPLGRRLGLTDEAMISRSCRTEDCADGLTRISGDVAAASPAAIAESLAARHALYLILDADVAGGVADTLPSNRIASGSRGQRSVLGPAAGDARFELIDRYWGRGALFGVFSGREERSTLRLIHRLPDRSQFDLESPATSPKDRLGGFDAMMYDPADATWSIFADPRPKPVWQRYGLPAPVLSPGQ